MKYLGPFLALFFTCSVALAATQDGDDPLAAIDWKQVMDKVVLLEGSGLMPTLLPVILKNQDTIGLTDEQVTAFRAWGKENYLHMVSVMNEIIEKMVEFRIESLSPDITGEQLLAFQEEIQELQRQLLKIKLSCRELIMTTFTDEQWDNFAFVVADNPKLASLMNQVGSLNTGHLH